MLQSAQKLLASVGLGAALLVTFAVPGTSMAASTARTLTMEGTAYGPSRQNNYPYGATNYFGQPLEPGDVAVDPSVIPLRTCLYVSGYSSPELPAGGFIGEADDEGGAVLGHHVDLYMNASPARVSSFGIQKVTVRVLGPAKTHSANPAQACAGYGNPAQTHGAALHRAASAHRG